MSDSENESWSRPAAVPYWHFGDSQGVLREHLAGGGVLGIPTESSYGLAVDPRSAAGVESIYRLKRRDAGKPLPVVVADLDQAKALSVDTGHPLIEVAQRHWPAPLTVVVPLVNTVPAAAGGDHLAVRIPAHPPLLSLLELLGHGLTATSANSSGEPPILDPQRLAEWLARGDAGTGAGMVVDGGVLPGGAPSTVVSWAEGSVKVVRSGRFPIASLAR